ncbi:MAG: nitroreductase family protein [Oscillospiraceae bacterium]|jgi:nitroreductase|nr:nitroreductase family protein [Oscillospiraceae bacterium]
MNEVIRNITRRRTIRRFKSEQVGEDALQAILQAGLYAPSAGGRQGVLFAVSRDNEVNERLGRAKRAHFHIQASSVRGNISKEQPSILDDPSIMNAFYDAPTVITLFGPKQFLYAVNDCSVAAENMMLAAASLGIGSCYIGSAWDSFDDTFGRGILAKWGVRTDYYAVAHVVLGYPSDDAHPTAKPRAEGRILWPREDHG